ncbi:hypothetical protein BDV12DRAFT_199501 [Aspergillus spectabilis]
MSPVKDSSSTSSGKESAPTTSVVRRSKTMPTDSPTAKFLYTIIKQLDLKGIDWTLVASQLEISNGHAARMRYHRFRNQMEGINPTQRKRQNKPSKTSINPCKAGLKKELSPQPSQRVKTEPSTDSPYQSNPYIKPEPYPQQMPRLTDIPQFASHMASVTHSHPSPYRPSIPVPYPQMTLSPGLRMYPSVPAYPPIPMGFEEIRHSPVDWTPVKAEPQSFSEERKEIEMVEAVVKEEVEAEGTCASASSASKRIDKDISIPTPNQQFLLTLNNQVDLTKVGAAMGYANIKSVANRFRALRAKYGFTSLESKMTRSTPPKNDSTSTKRGRGRPVQSGTSIRGDARKGAKVSTVAPIPAPGPVVKEEFVVRAEY